jgi:hypothetical protein
MLTWSLASLGHRASKAGSSRPGLVTHGLGLAIAARVIQRYNLQKQQHQLRADHLNGPGSRTQDHTRISPAAELSGQDVMLVLWGLVIMKVVLPLSAVTRLEMAWEDLSSSVGWQAIGVAVWALEILEKRAQEAGEAERVDTVLASKDFK